MGWRNRQFYGGAGVKGPRGVTVGLVYVAVVFIALIVLGGWAKQ